MYMVIQISKFIPLLFSTSTNNIAFYIYDSISVL